MTMKLISTLTAGSGGVANFDFTSIPQTYTDLYLVYSLRATPGASRWGMYYRFNNSSSAVYAYRSLNGLDSGTVQSGAQGSQTSSVDQVAVANAATSNTFTNSQMYIPNYTGSTNKSVSTEYTAENNSSSAYFMGLAAVLWSDTSAINRITIYPNDGSWMEYSSASLYGIQKGSGGATVA